MFVFVSDKGVEAGAFLNGQPCVCTQTLKHADLRHYQMLKLSITEQPDIVASLETV